MQNFSRLLIVVSVLLAGTAWSVATYLSGFDNAPEQAAESGLESPVPVLNTIGEAEEVDAARPQASSRQQLERLLVSVRK